MAIIAYNLTVSPRIDLTDKVTSVSLDLIPNKLYCEL